MTTKIEKSMIGRKVISTFEFTLHKVDKPNGQRNVIYELKNNIKCIMDNVSWSNELGAKPTYIPKYR